MMLNRIPPPFALSAGANSVSSGTLVFSNSNNVTFGLNGSTITGSASFAGGGFSAGVSTGGNTAGSTGVTGTRLVLVGTQNITLSQSTDANGATISISGGAGAAGNTGFVQAGANTASLGTVNFSNSNGISFGLNGQTMTGSHNALTSQSNQAASAANGSFAFQTLSFSNLNGISFGTSAGSAITASHNAITTARASTDAIGLNTAQTNVTWTVNSSGLSLNAGGYAGTGFTSTTTAGTAIVGTHNTAGLSMGVPAFLTTADLSANSSKYMQNWKLTGNTAGTTSSAQGTDVWYSGGANITLSGNSNTIVVVGAAAGTGAFSAGASNLGNTAGSTGITGTQLVLVGSGAISLSQSTGANGGTLSINAPPVSTLSATGWASLSTNGSTLFIGASTTMNLYASSNTFGTSSGTADMRSISIAGAGGASVAASNSGWVISAPIPATASFYENNGFLEPNSLTINNSGSSIQVQPFMLPYAISASFLRVPVSMSAIGTVSGVTSANSTMSIRRFQTDYAVIYSQGVGASSRSIQSVVSGSAGWTFETNVGAAGTGSRYTVTWNVTYPLSGNNTNVYTTSWAQSSASFDISTASMTLFTGPRMIDIPFANSLSPGNYWIGFGRSTNTGSQASQVLALSAASIGFSTIGMSQSNLSWGVPGAATSASDNQIRPGGGIWTTNSFVGSTASMALSQISNPASNPLMYWQLHRYN